MIGLIEHVIVVLNDDRVIEVHSILPDQDMTRLVQDATSGDLVC